jgi:glycosyltransferase involved in cell wall biosynthesis
MSHRQKASTGSVPQAEAKRRVADAAAEPGRADEGANNVAIPRVSVVIIFHNAAEFLEEAIRSVLTQDFRSFELLLVDDGSTDGSSSIAADFAASGGGAIRCLRHPDGANRGMSASRNLGIEWAQGELIAFIDSDDRWRSGKLREQVALFDLFPEVDAVFGSVNYWHSWAGGQDRLVRTGHVQNRPVPPPAASLRLYPLGHAAAPCPSDLMVRRSAARRLGGFEESFTGALQMYEDQAFLAKLYLDCTVYFDERCWLDYRRHDASCVASVTRDGRYEEVRSHFLSWFDAYLSSRRKPVDPRVRAALDRALFSARHPALARPLRMADKLLRKRIGA